MFFILLQSPQWYRVVRPVFQQKFVICSKYEISSVNHGYCLLQHNISPFFNNCLVSDNTPVHKVCICLLLLFSYTLYLCVAPVIISSFPFFCTTWIFARSWSTYCLTSHHYSENYRTSSSVHDTIVFRFSNKKDCHYIAFTCGRLVLASF